METAIDRYKRAKREQKQGVEWAALIGAPTVVVAVELVNWCRCDL